MAPGSPEASEERLYTIHARVTVATMCVEDAKRHIHALSPRVDATATMFLEIEDPRSESEVGSIQVTFRQVYWLCKLLESKIGVTTSHVVFCVDENRSSSAISGCCTLVGAYLLLIHQTKLDEVDAIFAPLLEHLTHHQAGWCSSDSAIIKDCWRALETVKGLGWLSEWYPRNVTSRTPPCIDMNEFLCYDDPCNGGFHAIIPGRLFVFNCPTDLPEDPNSVEILPGMDVDGERLFDGSFYANLWPDLDIALVVQCCGDDEYDASKFKDFDIPVEQMNVNDGGKSGLLQHFDRFLTLARLAPGALAIHGDRTGLGLAEALICSLLMREYHFDAKAAVAWISMVHPPKHVAWLLFSQPDASATCQLWKHLLDGADLPDREVPDLNRS